MELKPGYKQTEVGVIPEEWDCVHIGDVAETSSGATPPRAKQQEYFDGGTIPWVKTLDLNNSSILETDECVTSSALQQTSLRVYPSGSVLVAMYGGFNQIGRTGMLTKDATINQALTAIRPDRSRLSSRFLLNYLNYRVEYWKSVASSSRKDPNITGRDVREFPIPLPPLKEQEAVGEALQDAEDQISILEELIAKKRDIQQAAMQELLTGKRRLPGFEGEWEVKRIADVGEPCSEKNTEGAILPVLTCSKHVGFVDSLGYFKNQVFSKDLSSYKVIRRDEIGYPANHIEEGSIGLQDLYGVALVSPIYVVFRVTEAVSSYFLHRLLKLDSYRHRFRTATSSSVDRRGSLRWKYFSEITVMLPPIKAEQDAIAAVLSDLEAELSSLEARLIKTRSLKQAIMNELLTGRTRLI